MIRRPPRSTQSRSSAASDVYKRQVHLLAEQQLERRVRRVVGVAVRLGILDALGDLGEQRRLPAEVEAQLATLELDAGPTRHVGDEHPHVVPDQLRVCLLYTSP